MQPIGGVVSIILLELAFGYAVQKSDSLLGGVIAQFLNNLAAGDQGAARRQYPSGSNSLGRHALQAIPCLGVATGCAYPFHMGGPPP